MLFLILTALGLVAWSLARPVQTAQTVQRACRLFAASVLPSLFAFSVAARILVRTGLCAALARSPLGALFSLFGLSRGGGAALTVGMLSGFPTGAAVLAEMYKRGEVERGEAERLLPFCNNAGASFVVGAVGSSILGSASLGRSLLLAQTAAVLTALCLTGGASSTRETPSGTGDRGAVSVFVRSVVQSASAMVSVCGYIVVFSVISEMVCAPFAALPCVRAVLGGLLELSGGVAALPSLALSPTLRLALCAGMLGFGGVCVFLQAADEAVAAGLPLAFYFKGKTLTAFLCALFALLFDALSGTPFSALANALVFVVIFTIAGVKNKIFFKKSVEKQKRMLYNSNENPCP